MPSRILQVVPTYYPAVRYGGPIRSVHGLSTALVRRGHEVHVYTTNVDGPGALDVPLDAPVDRDGVKIHYFPVPKPLRRLFWSPAMERRLRERVADFDVVHLHSVFLRPTWAAARAARDAGVPYLMAPRGALGARVIEARSQLVKAAWIRFIERRTMAQSAGIHVTAPLEADDIAALNLPMPEVFCVPNGVELPTAVRPLEATRFANIPRPYVLFLSRIEWKKGLDRLIAAWQKVPNLPLVIVGNDEANYRAVLDPIAQAHGVSNRIHFVGAASDEEKWPLYTNASLFVLPSYSENFGNVVAEAMAMACPVLVSPEVGIAPLIRRHDAGIVSSCEPEVLAADIRALLDDPERARRLGMQGELAVRLELTWDAAAAQMEAAYDQASISNSRLQRFAL